MLAVYGQPLLWYYFTIAGCAYCLNGNVYCSPEFLFGCCMLLYKSEGILRYGDDNRLVVEVDQGIKEYYYSMIPKSWHKQGLRHPAHITVVRTGKEIPPFPEHWWRYDGEKLVFEYSPIIHHGTVYYWLNTFCTRLEDIRQELGLSIRSEYTIPPQGFTKCFHISIGNKR